MADGRGMIHAKMFSLTINQSIGHVENPVYKKCDENMGCIFVDFGHIFFCTVGVGDPQLWSVNPTRTKCGMYPFP